MTDNPDDALEHRCPIDRCEEALVLTITSCVPLYRHDPPWPGAGRATYDHDDAVSTGWVVECLAGHTVWNAADQIRAINAAMPEGEWLNEDDEFPPAFQLAPFLASTHDRSYVS